MASACKCPQSDDATYRCMTCGAVRQRFTSANDDVDKGGATPITEVSTSPTPHTPTNMSAVDDVLGGGVVDSAVCLLGGEPGIGKSTLLMQMAGGLLAQGKRVLYISAEETAQRARERCERLGLLDDNLLVSTETEVGDILKTADNVRADILLLDSIQRLHDDKLDKQPGCPAQMRQVCDRLLDDKGDLTVFIVGHVTKGGDLAGPKFLEHMVDVVLHFSRGDGDGRLLSTRKNRFGPTAASTLTMTEEGLVASTADDRIPILATDVAVFVVADPSALTSIEATDWWTTDETSAVPMQKGKALMIPTGADGTYGFDVSVLDEHVELDYLLATPSKQVTIDSAELASDASSPTTKRLTFNVQTKVTGVAFEVTDDNHIKVRLAPSRKRRINNDVTALLGSAPSVDHATLFNLDAAIGKGPACVVFEEQHDVVDDRWRVLHGDALHLLGCLPPESVDGVVTDPPYGSGTKLFPGDVRDQHSYLSWCSMWLAAAHRAAKPRSPVCVFAQWKQLPVVIDALQAGGWTWRGIAVWDKTAGGARPQKGRFRDQCEYVVWGSKGAMPWEGKCLDGVWTVGRDRKTPHPTSKPVPLMEKVIEIVPAGGKVLDPFCGSGSTLVAALKTGRTAIGIEMQKEHVATSHQRCLKQERKNK